MDHGVPSQDQNNAVRGREPLGTRNGDTMKDELNKLLELHLRTAARSAHGV